MRTDNGRPTKELQSDEFISRWLDDEQAHERRFSSALEKILKQDLMKTFSTR